MKKNIILVCCILITATCSIQAQNWNAVEFPNSENINGASFVNEDTAFFVTHKGKLIRTFDRLKSFDTFNPAPGISLEDVYFLNSDIGFICGSKGTFMKTTDGGYTFSKIPVSDTVPWFFDVEMFDNTHGLLIGMSRSSVSPLGGLVFRTDDGGKNWTKVKPFGLGLSEIGYFNNTVKVQSFGRMNSSTDFGKTWKSDSTLTGNPGRAFSFFNNTGIICGLKGMCGYTNDGGKIWLPAQQDSQTMFIAAQMINVNDGYIGGTKSTILKTTDGGRSWNEELMAKSFDVYDFVLVKNRLYAVGSDGGIIWKKVK